MTVWLWLWPYGIGKASGSAEGASGLSSRQPWLMLVEGGGIGVCTLCYYRPVLD